MTKKKKLTLQEIELAMSIGNHIIDKMQEQFPHLMKAYDGKYRKYIDEYKKQFIEEDLKEAKDSEFYGDLKQDLEDEIMHIECFCRWLEEEQNVLPRRRVVSKTTKK
jgi:hypothetical protein